MKLFKILALCAALGGAALTLSSCRESDTENAVEDVGESAGEVVEDAQDSMGDAAEEAGESMDDAGEAVEEVVE